MSQQSDYSQPAVEAMALCKSYEGRDVLRNLDLKVARGETLAITGSNGVGKTTLLCCLAAITRPDGGLVRWLGRPASGAAATRRCIGLLTHQSQLYAHLTIYENLLFAARMCSLHRPHDAVNRWVERLELKRAAALTPSRVSHGMRRRAAIARSLIHDPPIVLLDEPFSALDDKAKQRLLEILLHLRARRRCICFSTHDAQLARAAANVIVKLESGRAVQEVAVSDSATEEERGPSDRLR